MIPQDRELFEQFNDDTREEYVSFLKEQRENDTQNKILKDIKENEND